MNAAGRSLIAAPRSGPFLPGRSEGRRHPEDPIPLPAPARKNPKPFPSPLGPFRKHPKRLVVRTAHSEPGRGFGRTLGSGTLRGVVREGRRPQRPPPLRGGSGRSLVLAPAAVAATRSPDSRLGSRPSPRARSPAPGEHPRPGRGRSSSLQ